jgi:hypothetical protein
MIYVVLTIVDALSSQGIIQSVVFPRGSSASDCSVMLRLHVCPAAFVQLRRD